MNIEEQLAKAECERDEARAMAEDNQRAASNLLAIIHGDGGHYEDAHGTVKACKDAEGVVSDLRLKLDAATYALRIERENVAELEERLVLCQRTNDRMRERIGVKPPPWETKK